MISSEGSPNARRASQEKPSAVSSRRVFPNKRGPVSSLRFRPVELIEISRHPPICDMDEEQFCASHARKRPDVGEDGLIGGAVFEWDENVLIHDNND